MNGTQYIGIIGWNSQTKQLANMLHRRLRHTEVLAVATNHEDGQKYARETLGLKHVYQNPEQLYELHQLTVICICSSAELHLDEIASALRSGTNVLVEQPLAANVSDCIAIEKLARSYPNQKVLLALPRRFDRQLIELQKKIEEGSLGHIVSVSVESYERYDTEKYSGAYPVSKGIFMDITLEDIDMVRWLTGAEFTSVYAAASSIMYPSLTKHGDADTAHVTAQTDMGFGVSFVSSRVGHQRDGYSLKVVGTKGEFYYDTRKGQIAVSKAIVPHVVAERPEYEAMVRDYTNRVVQGGRLSYGVEVGTKATEVAVAMTKSYVLQEVITLDK